MTAAATATTVEQVLVVPTLLFHEVGYFQGFSPNADRYLKTLLDPAYTSYRPRDEMEQDPSFKQLIPYCVFRCGEQIFSYRRDKGQGESRLLGKRSIGIGGHISSIDENAGGSSYLEGMRREIEEEVFLESGYRHRCVGLINDDLTEVGKVHLGIVHIFELDSPQVRPREKSIIQTGFATPAELARDRDQFETWSQICLDYLIAAE
jgi:predicted NUDIX family phosphoesterase